MGCQEHFHKAANQNFQKHLPNRRKHVQKKLTIGIKTTLKTSEYVYFCLT